MGKGKEMEAIIKISGELAPSVGKSIEKLQGKMGGINKKAHMVGAGLAAFSAAAIAATAKAGKALLELGKQFDEVQDSIRIGTGATGDALDGLMDDFDAVYKSVPTTMEDASQAIADYNTRLGLTGDDLQGLSKQAIQVSDMLGEDLGSTIEQSSKAFQQWNISAEDMEGAMDYIFKVSQSTGTGFNDLMSKMQQFGPQLQDMGFSFNEASAMVGQLDKAGVNTNEVLGAMKKSVTTLAKQGISASDGMQMYYEKIQRAGTAAEAASIASEVFGARAGSTMASAIRDGTLSVDDFTKSLEGNGETISGAAEDTYDFSERLQMLKQNAQVAFEPLANTVFDQLNEFMPTLQSLMEQIIPVINETVAAAMPFVKEFLGGAASLLQTVLPLISQLASTLMPILTNLMTTILPPILGLLNTIIPPLMQIMSVILPPISQIVGTLVSLLGNIISAILPPLKSMLDAILPAIQPIFGLLSPIASVLSTIAGIIGKIVSFGSGVLSKVIGFFTGGGGGGDVKGFATGGFTNGVSIAGEDPRYPTEAVISFNPAYRNENIGYWAKAGRMLGANYSTTGHEMISTTTASTIVDLGGITFSPVINAGSGDSDGIVKAIKDEYPEFLDMLEKWFEERGMFVYG